jgi:hypothetical protein
MDTEFNSIISSFGMLIESVESFHFIQEESVSQIRAKIRLYDGTTLRVREIQVRGIADAYSYYWLRPDDSVIIGWDNAPHHPELSNFPYHLHTGNRIEASEQMNLTKIFEFISDFFR